MKTDTRDLLSKVTDSVTSTPQLPMESGSMESGSQPQMSYRDMIEKAVLAMKKPRGVKADDITSYISSHWPVGQDIGRHVGRTLKHMVKKERLLHAAGTGDSGGRFRINKHFGKNKGKKLLGKGKKLAKGAKGRKAAGKRGGKKKAPIKKRGLKARGRGGRALGKKGKKVLKGKKVNKKQIKRR